MSIFQLQRISIDSSKSERDIVIRKGQPKVLGPDEIDRSSPVDRSTCSTNWTLFTLAEANNICIVMQCNAWLNIFYLNALFLNRRRRAQVQAADEAQSSRWSAVVWVTSGQCETFSAAHPDIIFIIVVREQCETCNYESVAATHAKVPQMDATTAEHYPPLVTSK